MKFSLTSHVSGFLVLLVFIVPFTVLAQQNMVEFQAKIDAERHAESDVSKLLWGCAGFAAPFGCLVGGYFGMLSPVGYSSSLVAPDSMTSNGMCAGSLVGCFGSLVPIYSYKSTPPSEQLIGKSPEYVDFYTRFYKAKTRRLRVKSSCIGASVGYGLALIGAVLLVDTIEEGLYD